MTLRVKTNDENSALGGSRHFSNLRLFSKEVSQTCGRSASVRRTQIASLTQTRDSMGKAAYRAEEQGEQIFARHRA